MAAKLKAETLLALEELETAVARCAKAGSSERAGVVNAAANFIALYQLNERESGRGDELVCHGCTDDCRKCSLLGGQ